MPLKTSILALESHDDFVSVRDRLSWAKTPRILLLWPKYEDISLSVLDLRMLERHAQALGAQIGIVTRRARVQREVTALGIPAFGSTAAAQREAWRSSPRRERPVRRPPKKNLRRMQAKARQSAPPWLASPLVRLPSFALGVAAATFLALVLLPRAEVTLYPDQEIQERIIPVIAEPGTAGTLPLGTIHMRTVRTEVTVQSQLTVSGRVLVPVAKSRGLARFTNLTDSSVEIPSGTIVFSGQEAPVRYATLHDARLVPGTNENAEVRIEALAPGAASNVDAGAIQGVEGPLSFSVQVTNTAPTEGGSDRTATGASEGERSRLRQQVQEEARSLAESRLRATLRPGDLYLPESLEAESVLEETYTPQAGLAGESLTLVMRTAYAARYLSGAELAELARQTAFGIPGGFSERGTPAFELVEMHQDEAGKTSLQLLMRRTLRRDLDRSQAMALVRGQRPSEAVRRLRSAFPLREDPIVELDPDWWPVVPLTPFGISVRSE